MESSTQHKYNSRRHNNIYRAVVVISVSIRLMQNTSELTWHIDFETKHHEFVYANDKVLEKVFDATINEAK